MESWVLSGQQTLGGSVYWCTADVTPWLSPIWTELQFLTFYKHVSKRKGMRSRNYKNKQTATHDIHDRVQSTLAYPSSLKHPYNPTSCFQLEQTGWQTVRQTETQQFCLSGYEKPWRQKLEWKQARHQCRGCKQCLMKANILYFLFLSTIKMHK